MSNSAGVVMMYGFSVVPSPWSVTASKGKR